MSKSNGHGCCLPITNFILCYVTGSSLPVLHINLVEYERGKMFTHAAIETKK